MGTNYVCISRTNKRKEIRHSYDSEQIDLGPSNMHEPFNISGSMRAELRGKEN